MAKLCGLAALLTTPAMLSAADPAAATPDAKTLPLRLWAQQRNVQFGAALDLEPLRSEERYREIAGREFSLVTPGNTMKMGPLSPARGRYFWADADAMVAFAEAHAQRLHGHTLVWFRQNPAWLDAQEWTRDELWKVLHEHILTLVGRYKGRVAMWDVVNEAIADDGTLRPTIWQRVLGPGYIEAAFRWAHEADPAAVLLYNDYGGEGLGRKSTAIYDLLRGLKSRGIPVQGVGLQMHMILGHIPSEGEFRANLQRLSELGLELHVTEADVRIPLPATPAALAEQAANYRQLLRVFLENPQARSWTIWGITDRHSWVPAEFKGYGAALPWDENYQPKPAYAALRDALMSGN